MWWWVIEVDGIGHGSDHEQYSWWLTNQLHWVKSQPNTKGHNTSFSRSTNARKLCWGASTTVMNDSWTQKELSKLFFVWDTECRWGTPSFSTWFTCLEENTTQNKEWTSQWWSQIRMVTVQKALSCAHANNTQWLSSQALKPVACTWQRANI